MFKMSESNFNIVFSAIEKEKEFLNSISQNIWKHPELKFEEHHAHDVLTDSLRRYGFDVTEKYFLPTAFRAEYSSKQETGPTIAILLEYDALPEIGHGCGHNLIAEAGLAAGIAVKAAMEKDPTLNGKVVILGTPAEEGGGGKIKLIKEGTFKDIDAAMMVHPRPFTIYAPPTLSILNCTVNFTGRESHASAFPWEGLNALDAAVTFYQAIGLLRQQIKPSYRINAIILKGGTAVNVIPAETEMAFTLRAPTTDEVLELKARFEKCLKGAAMATGCSYTVKYDEDNAYQRLRTNQIIVKMFGDFATKLGLPETDTKKMSTIPAGSTDMGNVSHVVPSIQPVYEIRTNATNHTKDFAAASGSLYAQEPTLIAAKSMAMTVLTMFKNTDILSEAKKEFMSKN